MPVLGTVVIDTKHELFTSTYNHMDQLALIDQIKRIQSPNILVQKKRTDTPEPLIFMLLAESKMGAVSVLINSPGFDPNIFSSEQKCSLLHAMVRHYYEAYLSKDDKDSLNVSIRTLLTMAPELTTDEKKYTAIDIAQSHQPRTRALTLPWSRSTKELPEDTLYTKHLEPYGKDQKSYLARYPSLSKSCPEIDSIHASAAATPARKRPPKQMPAASLFEGEDDYFSRPQTHLGNVAPSSTRPPFKPIGAVPETHL